ncbi:MAG: helix-turn-helix transcriptional regulator [Gammaproteobacteria bacterium]
MSLAERIKQARQAAGLSQARFAELLGVTRSACTQWESAIGTVPRQQRLEQIARLLNVSYAWLATGERAGDGIKDTTGDWSVGNNQYRSAEIAELVARFEGLPRQERSAILLLLRAMEK